MSDYIVSFPGLGIHDLKINRVFFEAGPIKIYYYGLLIGIAMLLCMILSIREAKKYQLKSDDIIDFYLIMLPFIIVGARLYYVIFEWKHYAGNFKAIFDLRSGGLAFYGGVIGGFLATLIMAKIKKIPVHRIYDFLVVYIPLGQAIGRWGNFFNQEAFGTNTKLPWGMISNGTRNFLQGKSGVNPLEPVHPTFLYEFFGNMLIFLLLLKVRKKSRRPFTVTLVYLIAYGVLRFFVEGLRTDSLYIGESGLRISQVLSLLMVAGSLILLVVIGQREDKKEWANEQKDSN